MRIKMISQCLQAVIEVLASLATFGDKVAGYLDDRHPPAEGDGSFSYRTVFDHLRLDLESIRAELNEAKDQHVRLLARTSGLRRRGQGLASELYRRQVKARRILTTVFDPDRAFEMAAVTGDTPQVPSALADQVEQTVKLLKEPAVDIGPVDADGVTVDVEQMAAGLEARLEDFRGVQSERRMARKALGETKVVKDKAIKHCDNLLPWVARTLEGYFRIAGERELAERIRTSVRPVTRKKAATEAAATSDKETEEAAPPTSESATSAESAVAAPAS